MGSFSARRYFMPVLDAGSGNLQSKTKSCWTSRGGGFVSNPPMCCGELRSWGGRLVLGGHRTKSSPRWPRGLPCMAFRNGCRKHPPALNDVVSSNGKCFVHHAKLNFGRESRDAAIAI